MPSNMKNFATDSYPLTNKGSWCVKPNTIYTNPKANFGYFNSKCGDPYTYYNFWYRKFLPQVDPFLKNKFAYIGKPAECNTSIRNFGSNVSDNGFKYFVTRPNTNS
jgi:hypothetical protein